MGLPGRHDSLCESRQSRRDVRAGVVVGACSMIPWLIAAVGWTAHWNVYINLFITLGGGVIVWSAIAVTLDRYQRTAE